MQLRSIVILTFAVVLLFALGMHLTKREPSTLDTMLPVSTIHIDSVALRVEVATTAGQQEQGLSGRASLAEGAGMLFVFDEIATWGIWMKDMRFPLDIVWADDTGGVVTVAHDISPDTYPQVFYPTEPARYVLEVPAGFTTVHGVAEGSKLMVK